MTQPTLSIDSLRTMKRNFSDAIRQHGKEVLGAAFKAFFDAHPEVEAIRWTQYTPYFNDGDACVFSVNDFTYRTTDPQASCPEYADDDGFVDDSDGPIASAVHEFERGVEDDDIFEAVFGDHGQVTADRNGFTIDEYEHD